MPCFLLPFPAYLATCSDAHTLTPHTQPICRPRLIQEYKLTPYSLYAAVSVGVTTEIMLDVMDRLSKNGVPKVCVRA